jgi:GNAT superfamily N-acetyltransferase
MAIELVDAGTDPASEARIVSEVLRWLVFDPEAIEHQRARTPSRRDWIAVLDGQPVGVGSSGVPVEMDAAGVALSMLLVLREARHRGVGRLLYRRVSEHARELGRSELLMFAFEDDPDTLGFAARHDFTVVARTRSLRLTLAACPRPMVKPPAGVTIATLAERPELARGIWEVACAAFPDIPHGGGDEPMQAGSYEEFVAGRLSGPRYIPDATFAAVAGDEVIGYAQLVWMSRCAGIADHAMIAVRQGWRGRGVAQSLKAAQIAWAVDTGLHELRAGNEERNFPARAVNAHFPFVPLPDWLHLRGPAIGT